MLASSGEYLKFLDADDYLPPRAVEDLLSIAEVFKQGVVVGRSARVDESGKIIDYNWYNVAGDLSSLEEISPCRLYVQALHVGICLIPKAAFIDGVRFDKDVRLGEEFAFVSSLVKLGYRFYHCAEVVYHPREHAGVRLSRSASAGDYGRQLSLVRHLLTGNDSTLGPIDVQARELAAQNIWSWGRQCFRLGYFDVAHAHTELAYSLAGRRAVVGRMPYRILLAILGARYAERILQILKLGSGKTHV